MTEVGEQTQPAYLEVLSRWPLLHRLASDRRVRYVVAGGITSVTYYVVFSISWLLLSGRLSYLILTILTNMVTALLTYPMYRQWVFQWTGPWFGGFFRFYLTCLWALTFAMVGLPLLVELAHLHVLVALGIIIVAAPLINYQIQRFWTFRVARAQRPAPDATEARTPRSPRT